MGVKKNLQMSVDLASLPILAQESSEHTLSSHPEDLGGHTSLGGTLPLTRASVSPLSLSGEKILRSGAGVDDGRFGNDVTVLEELLDVLTRVGVADLSGLGGVQPNLPLAHTGDCTIVRNNRELVT